MIKANYKWLKVVLALGVKKLGPAFLVLILDKLPLFDNFFDFPSLLTSFTLLLLTQNLIASPLLLFFLKTDLLLLFFLEAGLLSDPIVLNIKLSGIVILI